ECIKALKEDSDRICSYDRPIVETSISIKSAYHEYSIVIDDIIFIESYGPKLIIHMKEGKIETYSSLKDMERSIKNLSNSFYRSHKSYIVNLKYIKEISIQKQEITMITGDKCLIARSQKEFFKERSKNKKILRLNQ
ncbi:MAG: LytTR family DNA-binding domain-containing protein, partial [Clostridium sp.]|nr:LytTR family DNA-binding domain-containing protein [Clostridium sp.]